MAAALADPLRRMVMRDVAGAAGEIPARWVTPHGVDVVDIALGVAVLGEPARPLGGGFHTATIIVGCPRPAIA